MIWYSPQLNVFRIVYVSEFKMLFTNLSKCVHTHEIRNSDNDDLSIMYCHNEDISWHFIGDL